MIANSSRKVDPSGVVRLSDVKVRRRRDTLLISRRGFAKSAAEHRSHGLDHAAAVWSLQLAVEQTIEDEFPLVYAEQFGLWGVMQSRVTG